MHGRFLTVVVYCFGLLFAVLHCVSLGLRLLLVADLLSGGKGKQNLKPVARASDVPYGAGSE